MFLRLAMMLALFLITCCVPGSSSTAELRARTALNALADVVDPAYDLAMLGCRDLEDRVMREGEAGQRSAVSTETTIAAISQRCHKVRSAFDELRAYHEQAVQLVMRGDYEQALAILQQTREAWQTLRERTIDP